MLLGVPISSKQLISYSDYYGPYFSGRTTGLAKLNNWSQDGGSIPSGPLNLGSNLLETDLSPPFKIILWFFSFA